LYLDSFEGGKEIFGLKSHMGNACLARSIGYTGIDVKCTILHELLSQQIMDIHTAAALFVPSTYLVRYTTFMLVVV